MARGKDLIGLGKDLFDSVFGGEDELEGDEFMDYANDLQKKLLDMTGSETQASED